MRNVGIEIDLKALAHNLQQVKNLAPNCKVLAMVKANAYGHGLLGCLPALQQADALGVACLVEAKLLLQAGWQKKIVLMEGAFSFDEWLFAKQHGLECVIHHQQQLTWALQSPTPHTVWLKFNTGMNRLGFLANVIVDVAKQLQKTGHQMVLTSHFANADDIHHPKNHQQQQQFADTLTQLQQQISGQIQGSLCNSAGIVNYPNHHYDWVRTGIMLYGATPVFHKEAKDLNLQPVMKFFAHIMAIKSLDIGETVSYGSRWQAQRISKIGIVCVGYADGYPRVVADTAYLVTDDNQKLSIIGRVSMDMLMVDLTDSVGVEIGTRVHLWGNLPTIDEVASWNGTISYELLCLITQRPDKTFVN